MDRWVCLRCDAANAGWRNLSWYYPTTDGWGRGDHVIRCAVYDPLDSALTASLKGANR